MELFITGGFICHIACSPSCCETKYKIRLKTLNMLFDFTQSGSSQLISNHFYRGEISVLLSLLIERKYMVNPSLVVENSLGFGA